MGGGMPGGMMGNGGGMQGMMGNGGGMQGMQGMMGGNSGAAAGTTESGEVTWWYHYPVQGIHYSFLLNNKGKVIQIQQFGWSSDKALKIKGKLTKVKNKTRQGIGLGSSFTQVLAKYNFSGDGDRIGDNLTLRYGTGESLLAFQLVKNKVAGISLGYKKPEVLEIIQEVN